MRSLFLAAALLAGCTETGAHLTFKAPAGPRTAGAFRVVLATPETIPSIRGQRIKPGTNETQTVSYFLQRTVAGASDDPIDEVNGFTLRIAPDSDVADTQFIPFVLLYDIGGHITGVGTYHAGETPMPSPILVMRDEIDKYTLDVEPVTEVGPDDAPGAGQIEVIECANRDPSFTSGYVWRQVGGSELRLLLPDDGGTDATGRKLDLDCDDHEVTPDDSEEDCDDTRAAFHQGAADVCDGLDTNCDGARAIATSCDLANTLCTDPATQQPLPGVQLCDDATGQALGCQPTATCACNAGGTCVSCELTYTSGSTIGVVRPCQPATGVVSTYGQCTAAAPCTVEVLGASNGWKIEVASATSSSFGVKATGVADSFSIRAKRPEGTSYEVMGMSRTNLADINFAFETGTATKFVPVRLVLSEAAAVADCGDAPTITCYP